MTSVLVVAAGGVGPFVQMLGALAALRIHHRNDHITLLTAAETVEFAVASRLADDVWCDTTQGAWDFPWDFTALLNMRRRLREKNFAQVYDLDGGRAGKRLFRLMRDWGWSGARRAPASWCRDEPGTITSHRQAGHGAVHLVDRIAAQLLGAGIPEVPATDLTWVARQVTSFNVPFRMTEPFVLLACDPAITGKDTQVAWPSERWTSLGAAVAAAGFIPILVGLSPAPSLREALAVSAPRTVDLTEHTTISDLVFLAWAAKGAVGGDNGLMHLFAIAGCRSVVLYDATSDPARNGQRGRDVAILRRATLAEIPAGEVMAALRRRA
ncbi:MAG: hypothetical protein EPO08_20325 [Rhodospirillaceae bacterium]|nr:MAG: hypothetical protein EPO08_20325 [Rhodospirillaceae bacterium]